MSNLRYRPELDGLRAIAVLLVVVHHCLQPHRFAGFVGVDVFFVLSGFLITSILDREIDRSGGLRLRTFYAKRLLRLYPALLAMLVVTIGAYHWLLHSLGTQVRDAVIAGTYTGNLYMTYRHHWLGPYTHTWSLALEEQYYLVWPLVLLVALRLGVPRRLLAVVVLALAAVASALTVAEFRFDSIDFPVQSTSAGLLLGSALALGWASVPGLRRVLAAPAAGALAVALLIASLVMFSVTGRIPSGSYVVASIVATALVIGHTGARTGRLGGALSWRPAVLLGRISYGVYLWHYPVLFVVNDVSNPSPWVRIAIVLPLSIAIAAASYRVVEQPFLRRKDRLGRSAAATREPARADDAGAAPPAAAR